MARVWVLLDDEGQPIRYFDYAHKDAIEVVEKPLNMNELYELLGECLL